MIEIVWTVSLDCVGGKFYVENGTAASDIARMVDENVQRSITSMWSPFPRPRKDSIDPANKPPSEI